MYVGLSKMKELRTSDGVRREQTGDCRHTGAPICLTTAFKRENVNLRPFLHCGVQMELGESKPWEAGAVRASSTGPSFIKSFI